MQMQRKMLCAQAWAVCRHHLWMMNEGANALEVVLFCTMAVILILSSREVNRSVMAVACEVSLTSLSTFHVSEDVRTNCLG